MTDYLSSLEARISLIKSPTMILSGIEDIKSLEQLGLATPANRQYLAQLIPQAEIIEIEGGICMMNLLSEVISNIVLDFLDGKMV